MPSIRSLGLQVNPSEEPLAYPGVPVTTDALLVRDWLYRVDAVPGTMPGDWRPRLDGGPLPATVGTLDAALALLGAAPMSARRPCVAVGSNASPGQLLHKYGRAGAPVVVPLTVATVHGLGIGFSAHVSRAGYLPYAPVAAAGEHRRCVLWLDGGQLAGLDATEPNYVRRVVPEPAVLASGVDLGGLVAYRGRWGILSAPDGGPVAVAGQAEILAQLLARPWFGALLPGVGAPDGAVRRLSADGVLRDRVREAFEAHGWVEPDGLPWE